MPTTPDLPPMPEPPEIPALDEADLQTLARAGAEALQRSGLVAIPTDTQYALSVLASRGDAVMHCYAVKQRPDSEAMPVFISSMDELDTVATDIEDGVRELAASAWPGSLTLVLPKNPAWHSLAVPSKTVAVRMPDHPLALAVLEAVGEPITGSSANRHGEPPAASQVDVRRSFSAELETHEVTILPDMGSAPQGIASTILDCTSAPPRIVRPGATSEEEVDRLIAQYLPQGDSLAKAESQPEADPAAPAQDRE
jgi:L-threonylcarbamoyladenylate synthase